MSDAVEPDHADADLVLEYELDAPPEKVWRAVTIPALRERWLPDCDLAEAEPLSSIAGEEVRFRLRESEPPFRESHVTFRIEPSEAGGTRFRIIQEACGHRANRPQAANTNCRTLMRAA
ncbi:MULTISPECIES: SRPBCC domain-containing protein [Bradyrhizobium]|uniref:SRPBCC domain-containing protein n=1 Tax=Bradyrhizobium elkanii TaxID=29448 RepID=A0A4U6S2L0_BRAEL|nr:MULTISPECIES: SRPBCC domain-containing protein [Bradyrhizobium]MTV17609.1 SRPBCC domain-containing protein [Bradyrhizobium sp. BR2003]TKV81420.1 SRPBCC domain-containing protein [Bradyrhizobium elkanii]